MRRINKLYTADLQVDILAGATSNFFMDLNNNGRECFLKSITLEYKIIQQVVNLLVPISENTVIEQEIFFRADPAGANSIGHTFTNPTVPAVLTSTSLFHRLYKPGQTKFENFRFNQLLQIGWVAVNRDLVNAYHLYAYIALEVDEIN